MSSDGDIIAFQNSMNDNLEESTNVLFSDKNYTYITDSTSNSGSFASGQIQFDLATLQSQSQWIDLRQAVIEFPIKITTQLTTAIVTGSITNAAAQAASVVLKNGFNSWIDGCQLIVNGQTIQSMQMYENICAQFRIISTFSQDSLKKLGPTLGFAIDDMSNNDNTAITKNSGLANAVYADCATSVKGFDTMNPSNSAFVNKGAIARSNFVNNDINNYSSGTTSADTLQTKILGASSMKTAGRSNVAIASTTGSNTATSGSNYLHTQFIMATVRLCDLCDIKDFPLTKNLKGFLTLAFNSARVDLTGTLTGAPAVTATLASVSTTALTGRTTPFLINNSATGITLGSSSSGTVAAVVSVTGSVDATSTGALGSSGPILTNARMLVPFYIANPSIDSALTMSNKFFTSYEKIVVPITIAAGTSINYTITTGVANPRRLMLLPMWQNLGGATNLTNPETSPFDTVPQTSGVYAGLSNLQVYMANKPLFQYPIQYDFEQYIEEQSQLGLNGNAISEQTSGLMTQQLFEQNHRFYTVDLSRRISSEDGASKSIQVSCTNPSATFGQKVIAVVWYEKKWIMNTGQGQLSSV